MHDRTNKTIAPVTGNCPKGFTDPAGEFPFLMTTDSESAPDYGAWRGGKGRML